MSWARRCLSGSKQRYEAKEQIVGAQAMRYHERMIMLSVLDGLWKDHLLAMDQLKEGIGLRGYGQQDPLISYKRESFEAFEAMMTRFQEDTVRFLYPNADHGAGWSRDSYSVTSAAGADGVAGRLCHCDGTSGRRTGFCGCATRCRQHADAHSVYNHRRY